MSHKGFTLVEILVVLTIVGLLALPFTNMFIFGVQGSHDNTEHVLAYNLAREKLEEIKGLPFDLIKSDFDNFRDVFQDRPDFDDAYLNDLAFENFFSDVFCELSMKDDKLKTTFLKLKELYPKSYLKPLSVYSEDYLNFRRIVKVESISQTAQPPRLKKITVLVFDQDNKKIAELATFAGLHK